MKATTLRPSGRRWGAGTAAVVRSLIWHDGPVSGTELARQNGISQPRSVQILQMLAAHNAVKRTPSGFVGDVDRLFEMYATHARPRVIAHGYWYSPRPLMSQAQALSKEPRLSQIGFSADIGCDLIAPWRIPTLGILYCTEPIRLEGAPFVRAEGLSDATITVRVVDDQTLFPSPLAETIAHWPASVDGIPLIDPVQQWQDLLALGGEDRIEAAAVLRLAIVNREIRH